MYISNTEVDTKKNINNKQQEPDRHRTDTKTNVKTTRLNDIIYAAAVVVRKGAR